MPSEDINISSSNNRSWNNFLDHWGSALQVIVSTVVRITADENISYSNVYWQSIEFSWICSWCCSTCQSIDLWPISWNYTGIRTHCNNILECHRAKISSLNINHSPSFKRSSRSNKSTQTCRDRDNSRSSRINSLCVYIWIKE